MNETNGAVKYRIDKSLHKGLGLFANRRILRGELILSEKPLLVVDRSKNKISNQISDKISKLSDQDKNRFYSLYDCYLPSTPTALGIYETNCLTLGHGSSFTGVFPIISRINHSCVPNSYHSWNEIENIETIYAIKDIEPNEEIFTSYIDLYSDKATRQRQLKKIYRFDCTCELCSKNINESKKSDIRRKILSQLDDEIASLAWSIPDKAITKAEQILKYLRDENMFYMANYVGRVGYDVFQILFMTNKTFNTNIQNWARLTIDNYMICSGNYDDCILKNQLEFFSRL